MKSSKLLLALAVLASIILLIHGSAFSDVNALSLSTTTASATYNPGPNNTSYTVNGTITGFSPDYSIKCTIYNSADVAIITSSTLTSQTAGTWSFSFPNAALGGVRAVVCAKSPSLAGTEVCASSVNFEYSVPIPTLSEWAMIIMGVLLLGLMTYYVIKRKRTANAIAI